jgi:hypothetical protein
MVILICNGIETEFGELMAQNILQIQADRRRNGTVVPASEEYELPIDSPFEFKGNGLIAKPVKRNTKETSKRVPDTESGKPLE